MIQTLSTRRLSLRMFDPAQAESMQRTLSCNVEHLSKWLPWIQCEPTVEQQRHTLANLHREFLEGTNCSFAIMRPEDDEILGAIGIHRRIGAGGHELGYWISHEHTGQGFVTEAAAALTAMSFEHCCVRFVEIQCDPLNTASSAIPLRLGYVLSVEVPGRILSVDGAARDTQIYRMGRAEFEASELGEVAYRVEGHSSE